MLGHGLVSSFSFSFLVNFFLFFLVSSFLFWWILAQNLPPKIKSLKNYDTLRSCKALMEVSNGNISTLNVVFFVSFFGEFLFWWKSLTEASLPWMSSCFQVSQVKVATVLLADLEGDFQTFSNKTNQDFYMTKTIPMFHNIQLLPFPESEKGFKLSLVLRTWHLVARPEEPFRFQYQKGFQFFTFPLPKRCWKDIFQTTSYTIPSISLPKNILNYLQTTPLHCARSCCKNKTPGCWLYRYTKTYMHAYTWCCIGIQIHTCMPIHDAV